MFMNGIFADNDKFQAVPPLSGGAFQSLLPLQADAPKLTVVEVAQRKSWKRAAAEILTLGNWPTQGRAMPGEKMGR